MRAAMSSGRQGVAVMMVAAMSSCGRLAVDDATRQKDMADNATTSDGDCGRWDKSRW